MEIELSLYAASNYFSAIFHNSRKYNTTVCVHKDLLVSIPFFNKNDNKN